MQITVSHNQTLLDALSILLPQSSKNSLRQFMRDGRCMVDGVVTKENQELFTGQIISFAEKRVKYEGVLKIVFEDRDLVVVEKPSGLLSVSTAYETEETVHSILKERYRHKVYVIHRLDFETSGLMIFARTEAAYQFLKDELFHRRVKRVYIAICEGALVGNGTWQCHLVEDKNYNVHIAPQGELAITHYEALECKSGFTRVRCTLQTGKKHQIRIHASNAGHPVVGDFRYGAKTNRYERLALHAEQLSFVHPSTKKLLSFSSLAPF